MKKPSARAMMRFYNLLTTWLFEADEAKAAEAYRLAVEFLDESAAKSGARPKPSAKDCRAFDREMLALRKHFQQRELESTA